MTDRLINIQPITGKTGQFLIANCLIVTYELPGGDLVLLDTGSQFCPPLFQYLDEENIRVRAVIHTHLHEDHIFNDLELQQRYGSQIFAAESEVEVAGDSTKARTVLGLTGDFSTKYNAYVNRLDITAFPEQQKSLLIGSSVFRLVPLPGHSSGHTGILTPDGVFCVGDAVLSDYELAHAKAPYEFNIRQTIKSFEAVRSVRCPYYALAHRQLVPLDQIDDLLDRNRGRLQEICEKTLSLVRDGMTEEELVDEVARAQEIHHDYRKYIFIYIAIREELEYAIESGEVRAEGTGRGRKLYLKQ